MKVLLALIFFCLSWCNYTFSKEINIESKILLNVPDNYIFIEGDSKSEFIEPIISFIGNDVKAYSYPIHLLKLTLLKTLVLLYTKEVLF